MAKAGVDSTPGSGKHFGNKVTHNQLSISGKIRYTCPACKKGQCETQFSPQEIARFTASPKEYQPICMKCEKNGKGTTFVAEWQKRREESLKLGRNSAGTFTKQGTLRKDLRLRRYLERRWSK